MDFVKEKKGLNQVTPKEHQREFIKIFGRKAIEVSLV
jgi:hypothetical protein